MRQDPQSIAPDTPGCRKRFPLALVIRLTAQINGALLIGFFAGWANAQVNKCLVGSKVTYQQAPCAGLSESVNLSGVGRADPTSPAANYWKSEAARIARKDRATAAIQAGQVFVGMTLDEVVDSWGPPTVRNRSIAAATVTEQWVYRRGDVGRDQYIYLTDGIVRSMQSP